METFSVQAELGHGSDLEGILHADVTLQPRSSTVLGLCCELEIRSAST